MEKCGAAVIFLQFLGSTQLLLTIGSFFTEGIAFVIARSARLKQDLEPSPDDLALIRGEENHRTNSAEWEAACSRLLAAWESSIRGMARKYAPFSHYHPDFAQVARMVLIRAAQRFRVDSGTRFENYARITVRHTLIDECRKIRRYHRIFRLPGQKPCDSETGLNALIREEVISQVNKRIGKWVARLRELIKLLFVHELSQVEAAQHLGLTSARISQLVQEIRRIGREDLKEFADHVN